MKQFELEKLVFGKSISRHIKSPLSDFCKYLDTHPSDKKSGVGVFWGWLYGLFSGRDATYTAHFYYSVSLTHYLVFVCNEFWFGRRKLPFWDFIIFCGWLSMFHWIWHICGPFLYFPTFVFSHLVFRDGAFCGRLTCRGVDNICHPFLQPIALTRKLGIWIVRYKSGQKAFFVLLSSVRQNWPKYI